ncbi:uncharacterized protein LOC124957206 [Vespa velutina]|uniref:uncharacterized protein LOC124957206 n=1 Tax=Vespa velutina TaxID=202808 RepID=UPI001FB44EEB|nr:uncharacterized protein LOC124957206 [Vespa velutina]
MILKEKDFVDNEYYIYNRLLFKILGLWEYRMSFKQLIYVCFIVIMIILGIFQHIYTLYTADGKIKTIAKLLEITLPTLCFGSCYYNLLSNGAIMREVLYRIKCDWDVLANKPELMILKRYGHISRVRTIAIAIWFNLYIAFLILPSLLKIFQYIIGRINENELILPLRIDYFLKNQINYFLGISIQYMIIVLVGIIGIANYSMYIAVIQHAYALLNIVVFIGVRFCRDRLLLLNTDVIFFGHGIQQSSINLFED